MCVPSGMTAGSTATTPGPTGRPLAVYPGRLYATAATVSVRGPEGAGAGAAEVEDPTAIRVFVGLACAVNVLERATAARARDSAAAIWLSVSARRDSRLATVACRWESDAASSAVAVRARASA